MTGIADAFKAHSDELVAAASTATFIVFLCGPAFKTKKSSAKLRNSLKRALKKERFEVVVGEDDGINSRELKSIGINAQDSELEFIKHNCNAVIVIADSVGSFCELGLFSWHYVHEDGALKTKDTDFIVLIDQKYKTDRSYLNLGPTAAVSGFGRVDFVDFDKFKTQEVVERLKARRGVYAVDNRRGRPRGPIA